MFADVDTSRRYCLRGGVLVLAANRGVAYVNRDVAPQLRIPPANALRIALHPDGLASRISNFANWSGYLLARLRREIEVTGDRKLEALYEELVAYPGTTTEYDPTGPLNSNDALFMQELRLDDPGARVLLHPHHLWNPP